MREIKDYSDHRLKTWCLHCGLPIASVKNNRDHVPSKSLLTKGLRDRGAAYDRGAGDKFDYLPQVNICQGCNSSFSVDENYFLCVLHAVMAGSLYPDPETHPEASAVLRSNRHIVRALKGGPDGQLWLFNDLQPFTVYPDADRIRRVVLKNARGHAYHELGEPMLGTPEYVAFTPFDLLNSEQRATFETVGHVADLAVWPEVGSRMMVQLFEEGTAVGGWITVEAGRYRYSVDWRDAITVKTVIWEYLATETRWER